MLGIGGDLLATRGLSQNVRVNLPDCAVIADQPVALGFGIVELAKELAGHAVIILLGPQVGVQPGDLTGEPGPGFVVQLGKSVALDSLRHCVYGPVRFRIVTQLSQLGGQIAISKIFFPHNASIMPQMVSNPAW